MLFNASSKVNIAGALIVIMMAIMLLVPQPVHAEQVNGEYTIGFNIMHADKKNASIAEGYWNQPAKVVIKDGRIRVQTTINKHAWVTKFAISHNGSKSEVKTISVDEAANVRVTEFQVSNFTDLVESNVSVYIEEIDYEHSYTMYFKFKPETLALVKAEEPQVPAVTQPPTASQAPAASAPAQAGTASQAPAQEVEPVAQEEVHKESPTPTAAAGEQAGLDSALQADPSDKDSAASGAEGEAVEIAGKAGSDEGSGDESSDMAQQEKDASEISAGDESSEAAAVSAEVTLEEGGNVRNIAVVTGIIIVLIAIIAIVVYRKRHNQIVNKK